MYYFLFFFIFLLIFTLVTHMKHFLMTLLTIETTMLLFIFSSINMFHINMHLFLIFIVLSACEGALGLSVLVMLSRSYSSDYLMMFNMMN